LGIKGFTVRIVGYDFYACLRLAIALDGSMFSIAAILLKL
jgi:hypothetical protein